LVEIRRSAGEGLGLKIITDEKYGSARISEVIAGYAAHKTGQINVGDQLISANGVALRSLSHAAIVDVMKVGHCGTAV
jgi:C-terminal processing protease CtpA/Prc